MQTIVNHQDMSAVEALWTLYRQQSPQVRKAFRSRIDTQEVNLGAKPLEPYTIEELHARIAESERDSAEGRLYDFDEVMSELKEEFAHEDELEMVGTV